MQPRIRGCAMLDTIVKYLLGEFRMIAEAPVSFAVVVLAAVLIAWWALDWRYSAVISNRDSQITLATAQRDDYRDKLKGATPEEAKAKIDALEHAVNLTIGRKWEPLSKKEIGDLATKLKD